MRIDPLLPVNAPLLATLEHWAVARGEGAPPNLGRHVAADILRTRGLRRRYLPDFHLADPVWDMLLDLYVARARGQRVSILDLAIAAGVPRSTGVRWVNNLVAAGQLERHDDADDGRRSWVTLSPASLDALDRYFTEIGRLSATTLENKFVPRI